uniref:Auxilin-like protein n=1 Tax=Tanacetum cinerariifolium TaxID=118510 RepID=A0A699K0H8_TANCI|nr:auxilin-like protein [Tanacetum cinerariifolium]
MPLGNASRTANILEPMTPRLTEVDIGLDGGCDKPLGPADMLLYSWDRGLDVCVDLTGSSPLTQTGMVDFVPGQAVINDAQCKHGKYMNRCVDIGYGFFHSLSRPLEN